MTNIEKLTAHIKMRLERGEYTKLNWEMDVLEKLLVNMPVYTEDKVYDAICAEEEPKETDDSEVSYKTYNSTEINVGDELTDGEFVGVCVGMGDGTVSVVMQDGSADEWDKEEWDRTGRNFPVVEKILNALNNAEVDNA